MEHRQILFIFFLYCILLGCGSTKLIDIRKSSSALQLTSKQRQVIEPKLKLIRDIVDDYEFEKKQLDGDLREYRTIANDRRLYRYDGGLSTTQKQRNLSEIRTKVRKFLTQRNAYKKEIDQLLIEILDKLSQDQQIVFKELKFPELEIPRSLRRDPHADLRHIPKHLISVY